MIKSLRQACIEVCCLHEVMRCIGFATDDIYFGRYENDGAATPGEDRPAVKAGDLFVELRRLSGPSFFVCVHNPERKRKDWHKVLTQTAEAWNAGRYHDSHWSASEAKARGAELVVKLVAAGWAIPKLPGGETPAA